MQSDPRAYQLRISWALLCMIAIVSCSVDASHGTSGERVEVVRPSGLKQCEDQAASPEAFAKLLRDNGVTVFASSCASDGAMRMQMCGADRGLYYVFEIDAGALAKSVELGFTELKRMPDAARFRKIPCGAASAG
jgi:hypothetical protein